MSNPKGRFNATDNGSGPRRRLFFAAHFSDFWIVCYEHGGFGYHCHSFFIKEGNNKTLDIYQAYIKFVSLEEVKNYFSKNTAVLEKWDGFDY